MKVLIIRFSSIGDIVLTTPVIRGLKLQAGATVHYLTKPTFSGILRNNPYVDVVHELDAHFSTTIQQLKAEKFDLIVDLHHNLRSWRIKLALGVKSSAFNKLNLEKWLLVNLKINRLPDRHIVDRYLDTVAALGVKADGQGLDYFIPEKDEVTLSEYGLASEPYIALVIGATHFTKRMPREKLLEICQRSSKKVVLLGGKPEAETGAWIAREAQNSRVIDLCGQLNLNQSASLVKQAEWVLTHDTGLMHIAAAFQKNVLSIWGSTSPFFGMYPYFDAGNGQNHCLEVKGLSCRPCSKIGHKECPKGHFRCMKEQDVDQMLRIMQ